MNIPGNTKVMTEAIAAFINSAPRVSIPKMDVEGAEIKALKGMKETLRDNDVKLAIVAYHKVDGITSYKIIAPWLKLERFGVHVRGGIVYGRKKGRGIVDCEVRASQRAIDV